MNSLRNLTYSIALSAIALSATYGNAMAGSAAHAHMGHVATGWKDTPAKMGLLPTAIEEAKIAAFHAGLAAQKPDNLKWMQTHTHHVLHAVDASTEAKGPGKGYGVLKAAAGAAKHIGIAAKQKDASDDVKTHAVHVATSARNTVERAKHIVTIGKKILATNSAKAASKLVKQMAAITNELLAGHDANGDGQITWQKDEGGLSVANKHLTIMYKLEGIKMM